MTEAELRIGRAAQELTEAEVLEAVRNSRLSDKCDPKKMARHIKRRLNAASTKADGKIAKVMKEFESGTLKSSSGETVTSKDQALAIAHSEAGVSKG